MPTDFKRTRKKIAVVIPKYGLVGGAEQFAAELTERIARNTDYDIHVVANRWKVLSDRVTFHRAPIISFPKFLTTTSFAWFADRTIRAEGFDLVHTHDRIFAADLFTMHGIPHRLWVEEVRGKRPSLYDRATARTEERLIRNSRCRVRLSVSSLAKEYFLRAYPEATGVEVLHPGVDLGRYDNPQRVALRGELRGRYGIAPSETVILFVSMNFEIKGLDHVLAGLSVLRSRESARPWRLLVVGRGNVRKYQRMGDNLGIGDRIVFTGALEREELVRIYWAADFFCMLSEFDTFGLTVLEAMASSLPVVVSAHVGAKDLVENGKTGFIVEHPGNAAGTADILGRMLDKSQRAPMAKEALRTARTHDWEAAAQRMSSIYEKLLFG
jgi:UDP-glucose:(heptosyl)LPS alpha-1,3-glucosyltransferase